MGTHGAPAVSGDAGSELETGREEGGSCEREGKLGEHLFHFCSA